MGRGAVNRPVRRHTIPSLPPVTSHPASREHRRHSGEVLLPCVPEKDLAPGGGRPAQVSGRRDAVRQNGVSAAVEGPSAPDHHRGCARAGDLRAAGIQKALQIFNFRFSGGVGKHRDALRPAGRQHQIFRGPHRGEPQHDLPPRQLCRLAVRGCRRYRRISAPSARRPERCRSMGRGPSSQPPGLVRPASPHRARIAPRKITEDRISRISASGTSQPVIPAVSTSNTSPATRPCSPRLAGYGWTPPHPADGDSGAAPRFRR